MGARGGDRVRNWLAQLLRGLAIGISAVSGELSLALLLIIGFGLRNATEGFGIVAPLAGSPCDPPGVDSRCWD